MQGHTQQSAWCTMSRDWVYAYTLFRKSTIIKRFYCVRPTWVVPEFIMRSLFEAMASDRTHRTWPQVGKRRRESLEHSDESRKEGAPGNDESPPKTQIQAKSASEVCCAVLDLCMQEWKYKFHKPLILTWPNLHFSYFRSDRHNCASAKQAQYLKQRCWRPSSLILWAVWSCRASLVLWDVTVVKKITRETMWGRERQWPQCARRWGEDFDWKKGCVWVRLGGNVMVKGGWVIFATTLSRCLKAPHTYTSPVCCERQASVCVCAPHLAEDW